MSMHMNDWVELRGVGDFIPGGQLVAQPTRDIYGRNQMFGMGDFMPGGAFVSRPDSSVYGRGQMFGMGQSDLTSSIAQAQAELLKTKAQRTQAQSQLEKLKRAGATILRDVTSAVTGSPVAARAGLGVGTMALLAGGAYLVAKQMKWIK